jgi:hypothetical protein
MQYEDDIVTLWSIYFAILVYPCVLHFTVQSVIVKLHYESPRNTYKFIVYLYVNSYKLKVFFFFFFFISSYAH